MADIDTYRAWLASAHTDATIIETIELQHGDWGSLWLANWDEDVLATLEDGTTQQVFTKSNFLIQGEGYGDTTGQTLNLQISSLGGYLYQQLVDMDPAGRAAAIKLKHRLYLSTDLSAILHTPIPEWYVSAVTATFTTLVAELTATPMRNIRIGKYYTNKEFPSLAVI